MSDCPTTATGKAKDELRQAQTILGAIPGESPYAALRHVGRALAALAQEPAASIAEIKNDRPIEEGAPGIAVVMQQMPALMNAIERALLDAYLAGVDEQKQRGDALLKEAAEVLRAARNGLLTAPVDDEQWNAQCGVIVTRIDDLSTRLRAQAEQRTT